MSTRYEETQRDRDEVGRGVRRDVRESGRNIREAGGDIIGNWCGLWSNLLSGVSEAISPRSRPRRSSNVDDVDQDEERSQGLFVCDGGEFRISCGRSGGTSAEREEEPRSDRAGRRTVARYADRDRELDVSTR
jgi:hypothetical protein